MAMSEHEVRDDALFKLYRYDPSMVAALIFILLFIAITGLHLYQLVRTKAWFFTCFVIGGISKAQLSHDVPGSGMLTKIQQCKSSATLVQVLPSNAYVFLY